VNDAVIVRAPASSANLGVGFDVLAVALDRYLEAGLGDAPEGARHVDRHHPAARAFAATGGAPEAAIWVRSSIPMGRGLGFSGAARVAGAALGVVTGTDDPSSALDASLTTVLDVAADLEGHGDNAAAAVFGGVVAWLQDAPTTALSLRLGPTIGGGAVVAWIPEATTSTDRSRRTLPDDVARADAVHNLGRIVQLAVAFERDDPVLLAGATDDRLHQPARLGVLPHAREALASGVDAGAWCGWLSGSGPTVVFLCDPANVDAVTGALPTVGRTATLRVARRGVHLASDPSR
jgi:homoserine kinase